MSKIRSPQRRQFLLLTVFALCGACATSPRSESATSAAPTQAAAEPPRQSTPAEAPAGKAATQDEAARAAPISPAQAPASEQEFAVPPAEPKTKATPSRKREHIATAGVPASAPKRAGQKEQAGGSRDLLQDTLQPIPSDPPTLRTALEELLSAAEELSAGHSCDRGCKAYQSMQRAALRICELTPSDDPLGRCNSARSRVAAADQELKQRCGSCSR